jgi:hypothetical protein
VLQTAYLLLDLSWVLELLVHVLPQRDSLLLELRDFVLDLVHLFLQLFLLDPDLSYRVTSLLQVVLVCHLRSTYCSTLDELLLLEVNAPLKIVIPLVIPFCFSDLHSASPIVARSCRKQLDRVFSSSNP